MYAQSVRFSEFIPNPGQSGAVWFADHGDHPATRDHLIWNHAIAA